ncbi:MAG: hypothetical protein PQJ61_14410 [Spirochaetales bacterium]|uniref:Uncharacterized protein n=1 Tax=Candidatus Thalassospirochaeta sargassi TaxID=3119039 RepID=A0AAJ1IET7_9SPIO|nr:hypothetical protein [Spirochaetales bacterium]
MPQKGDIFDLGTNEYIEFIEKFDDEKDYVILYTREPAPSLAELKLHKLVPSGTLDGEYRKVGPNEKDRLSSVYRRAGQKRSDELDARLND